jgi:hypothetical protein
MTEPGPVNATDTVIASPLAKSAGFVTVRPQAVSRSTKNVQRIAEVIGRHVELILLSLVHQ